MYPQASPTSVGPAAPAGKSAPSPRGIKGSMGAREKITLGELFNLGADPSKDINIFTYKCRGKTTNYYVYVGTHRELTFYAGVVTNGGDVSYYLLKPNDIIEDAKAVYDAREKCSTDIDLPPAQDILRLTTGFRGWEPVQGLKNYFFYMPDHITYTHGIIFMSPLNYRMATDFIYRTWKHRSVLGRELSLLTYNDPHRFGLMIRVLTFPFKSEKFPGVKVGFMFSSKSYSPIHESPIVPASTDDVRRVINEKWAYGAMSERARAVARLLWPNRSR